MRGTVNGRNEAVVSLRLRAVTGAEQDIDFIIDTGFDGEICLPEFMAKSLGLLHVTSSQATLADGSTLKYEMYYGQLEWNGVFEDVIVTAIGDEPLLGMGRLIGHELRIEVLPGRDVEINQLP